MSRFTKKAVAAFAITAAVGVGWVTDAVLRG